MDIKPGGSLIRDMLEQERPREKAQKPGVKSLTDVELMAIIFATGIAGKSVIELSREILHDNGGHLSRVARLSVPEFLKRYKGIGPAKATTLLAALELGSRAAADARIIDEPTVASSTVAYDIVRHRFERLNHEEFWVMYLSQAGKLIAESKIGQGGLTATSVDVRIIVREALFNNATAMILSHNHPSGNLKPSQQDITLTKSITDAARLFNIVVHDHIIVSDGGYYSFRDEGLV